MHRSVLLSVILSAVALSPAAALAAPVARVLFVADINAIDDFSNNLPADVTVGTTISGWFEYDPQVLPHATTQSGNRLQHNYRITHFYWQMGSAVYDLTPHDVSYMQFHVNMHERYDGDGKIQVAVGIEGTQMSFWEMILEFTDATELQDATIPTDWQDLFDNHTNHSYLSMMAGDSPFDSSFVSAQPVTSLASVIPEPGTGLLFAAALGFMTRRGRSA